MVVALSLPVVVSFVYLIIATLCCHAFIVGYPLVTSRTSLESSRHCSERYCMSTPITTSKQLSSRSSARRIQMIDDRLVVVTRDIPRNMKLIHSILPKEILSMKSFDIVNEDNLLDDEAIGQLLHSNNSVYLMYEAAGHSHEAVRHACKYTLYIPSLRSGHYFYNSTDMIIATCAKRLKRLVDGGKGLTYVTRTITDAVVPVSIPSLPSELLEAGQWSHFLSLTCPDVQNILPILPILRIGVDALELRVDLLDDITPRSIHRQVSLLQDFIGLPIVYTVRTKSQIGRFPDTSVLEIKALLLEGLRAGIDWLDMEASLPTDILLDVADTAKTIYSHTTKILGSLHDVNSPQSITQIEEMYKRCDLHGYADMLKVVTGAEDMSDCVNVQRVGSLQSKPFIGLCLGEKGSYSRVLNKRFTPVTHKLLSIAAPGQLSARQLMDRRLQDGLIRSKRFYLFGTPIKQSLSPTMHNQAYQALLLPHIYALNEQQEVHQYIDVMSDDLFGGASVTIPHKESIMPLLHEIRGAAVDIGAVNTVVVDEKRRLVGYNTDYIGIKRPIERLLRYHGSLEGGIGLVIGAGGTARAACYAIKDLGLTLVVTNRSPDKGRELADRFNGTFIGLDSLEEELASKPLKVIISTLPSSAGFTVPIALLGLKPVVFDVVYKPAKTALIAQAIENSCPFVQGATMLLEQGIEQFELWNQRRAPRQEMSRALFNGVEQL